MAGKKDQYSQMGYMRVVESAANTLTFAGLSVFSNVLGQKAMIIHRVEYLLSTATPAFLVADADAITFGLGGDDSLTTVALDSPQIYDYNKIVRVDYGTAGVAFWDVEPIVKDYTMLPGGGKLVPADRLFVWAQGVSIASAITVTARFEYTINDLSAQDYLELAQSLRVLR